MLIQRRIVCVDTPSSPVGALDREQFAGGIGGWGGWDAGASAHAADARFGERQAGAGLVSLAAEDRGDLPVGLVLGQAADQVQRVLGGSIALELAGNSQRDAQFGPRAAFPLHLHVGAAFVVVDGDDHLADQRAQQLLAVAVGR